MKNHNALFNDAQEEYFKTKSDDALNDIYRILFDLATNYIKNYGSRKNVYIADIETKAHDIVMIILERKFVRCFGSKIQNITSYIYFDCINVLTKDKEKDIFEKELTSLKVEEFVKL